MLVIVCIIIFEQFEDFYCVFCLQILIVNDFYKNKLSVKLVVWEDTSSTSLKLVDF